MVSDGAGGFKVASNAFQDVTDESGTTGMSVFVEEVLLQLGLTADDLLSALPVYGLVAIPTDAAREKGLEIVMAPTENEGSLGAAHAHVLGKKTGSIQKFLVAASQVRVWPSG